MNETRRTGRNGNRTYVVRGILLALLCVIAALPVHSSAATPLDEVAVPRRSADQLGIGRGDIFEVSSDPAMARPVRVRVAEIWDPPEHPADVARRDLVIQFHLPDLEQILDRRDLADRIVVRLKDPRSAEHVRDDLNGMGQGYQAYTATELAQQTSRSFVVISRFHRAIAFITLLASGIFLVTLTSLKFTELRREIGALRLLGVGFGTILLTVLTLTVVVAVAGTAIGIGAGAVFVQEINRYYQPLFATHLRFALLTATTIWVVSIASLLLGIGAGLGVGLHLIRKQPLDLVGR